jgi:hypothetical protein
VVVDCGVVDAVRDEGRDEGAEELAGPEFRHLALGEATVEPEGHCEGGVEVCTGDATGDVNGDHCSEALVVRQQMTTIHIVSSVCGKHITRRSISSMDFVEVAQ